MEIELWILLRLVIAALLSGVIGYERERTGKDAGLRTHMLVAVAAALFVSFTDLFTYASQPLVPPGPPGNLRLQIEPLATVEALVTGISFLGAGTIFVAGRSNRVQGLTTAASILATSAIGVSVGLERYILAIGSTVLIFVILRVVGWVEIRPRKEVRPEGAGDSQADEQGRQNLKHAASSRSE
jgi:putative Mg2+ transporter-C (MgtC) family protein